ncbi:hypothetical protein, partial [Priestia megaterium]|uniref:hypothetical protein n=1 Tax=Priestia megaterium TaxID=1404 RepID=UPI0035B573CD
LSVLEFTPGPVPRLQPKHRDGTDVFVAPDADLELAVLSRGRAVARPGSIVLAIDEATIDERTLAPGSAAYLDRQAMVG